MARNLVGAQHPITQDIPLPGNYQCLTLQLNYTAYRAGGTQRWVLIVRDPDNNLEVSRSIGPMGVVSPASAKALNLALKQALANVDYMLHGNATD
jgi:hypothetical protein